MGGSRHGRTKEAERYIREHLPSLEELRKRVRKLFRDSALKEMVCTLRDTGSRYLAKRLANGKVALVRRKQGSKGRATSKKHPEVLSRSRSNTSRNMGSSQQRRKHRHDHKEPHCSYCEERRERRRKKREEREARKEAKQFLNPRSAPRPPGYESAPLTTERTSPPKARKTRPPSTRTESRVAPRARTLIPPPSSVRASSRTANQTGRPQQRGAPPSVAGSSLGVSYSDYQFSRDSLSIFSNLHLDEDTPQSPASPSRLPPVDEVGKATRQRTGSVSTFMSDSGGHSQQNTTRASRRHAPLADMVYRELRRGSGSDEDDSSGSDYGSESDYSSDSDEDTVSLSEYGTDIEEIIDLYADD